MARTCQWRSHHGSSTGRPGLERPGIAWHGAGAQTVEFTLNGDRTWRPLRGQSYPVMPGMQLRTKATYGDRAGRRQQIDLLPFSMAQIQARDAIQISLLYGRLSFTLPVRHPGRNPHPIRPP